MSDFFTNFSDPYHYVYGCQVEWASNTTLTIAAGQVRPVDNNVDFPIGSALTVNAAIAGAGGLDTGTFAASTLYYVHVVLDATNNKVPAGIISTSATAPTLPFGYTDFVRVGAIFTDSSVHFIPISQTGNYGTKQVNQLTGGISVLAAGTETSFTVIDLSTVIPLVLTKTTVKLQAIFTPSAAGDAATFSLDGTTTYADITGVVSAKAQDLIIDVPCYPATISTVVKPAIYYKVAASGSLTLKVLGYVDNL